MCYLFKGLGSLDPDACGKLATIRTVVSAENTLVKISQVYTEFSNNQRICTLSAQYTTLHEALVTLTS
jgi:hypothetical protein